MIDEGKAESLFLSCLFCKDLFHLNLTREGVIGQGNTKMGEGFSNIKILKGGLNNESLEMDSFKRLSTRVWFFGFQPIGIRADQAH
jgi:hypothetical protein